MTQPTHVSEKAISIFHAGTIDEACPRIFDTTFDHDYDERIWWKRSLNFQSIWFLLICASSPPLQAESTSVYSTLWSWLSSYCLSGALLFHSQISCSFFLFPVLFYFFILSLWWWCNETWATQQLHKRIGRWCTDGVWWRTTAFQGLFSFHCFFPFIWIKLVDRTFDVCSIGGLFFSTCHSTTKTTTKKLIGGAKAAYVFWCFWRYAFGVWGCIRRFLGVVLSFSHLIFLCMVSILGVLGFFIRLSLYKVRSSQSHAVLVKMNYKLSLSLELLSNVPVSVIYL